MPSNGGGFDDYRRRCARRKARAAKLISKGIVPGSSKFYKLMERR